MLSLLALAFVAHVQAEIVNEGYYKIVRQGEHVGFSVRREEFDSAKREWTLRTYVFTYDRDHVEHHIKIMTRHSDKFEPLESTYEEIEGGKKTQSHITFTGAKFRLKFKNALTKTDEAGSLQSEEFLRHATYRVLLKNPVAKGKIFRFTALREEFAQHHIGQIQIRDIKRIIGHTVYQVVNDFDLFTTEGWLAENGQLLFIRVTNMDATETLVPSADAAIGRLEVNRSEMVGLFNEIPSGKKNWLALTHLSRDPKWFDSNFKTKPKTYPEAAPLRLIK